MIRDLIAHSRLKSQVLVRLSELGVFAWSSPCAVATPLGTTRPTRFGLPGQPDIMAILPGGRFLGIEVKTGSGRQSPEQRNWQARALAQGALYIVVRDLEDLACCLTLSNT